jgi:multicomponent Na+:H+ antiporter subunit D
LWRVLLYRIARAIYTTVASVGVTLQTRIGDSLDALRRRAGVHFGTRPSRAGVFARAWSIGTTALWIAALLTAYVLVYVL